MVAVGLRLRLSSARRQMGLTDLAGGCDIDEGASPYAHTTGSKDWPVARTVDGVLTQAGAPRAMGWPINLALELQPKMTGGGPAMAALRKLKARQKRGGIVRTGCAKGLR